MMRRSHFYLLSELCFVAPMPQPKTSLTATNPAVIAGAITLLAAFGAGCGSTTPAATMPTDNTTTPPPANNGAMAPLENKGSDRTAANYKDGSYNATGSYMVHAGAEQVQIGLTIKDGIVTDTTFQGTPKFPMSQRYMDMFNQNYKTMVVGKKLSEIKLGKVSGSSLTPIGFNDAVEKIKQQAVAS
jgi:uncharacterized protein with FMN-binding domain